MAEAGHNIAGVAGDKLAATVERIEILNTRKHDIGDDLREVYARAKLDGFDTKALRKLIARRARDKDDLDEEETLIAIYERALGEYAKTPLGIAAVRAAREAAE